MSQWGAIATQFTLYFAYVSTLYLHNILPKLVEIISSWLWSHNIRSRNVEFPINVGANLPNSDIHLTQWSTLAKTKPESCQKWMRPGKSTSRSHWFPKTLQRMLCQLIVNCPTIMRPGKSLSRSHSKCLNSPGAFPGIMHHLIRTICAQSSILYPPSQIIHSAP